MDYWGTKSRRLATYREMREQCERELAQLDRLIREEEYEPFPDGEGDVITWMDYLEKAIDQEK